MYDNILKGFKILITEDDPVNCTLLKALLHNLGAEYIWAKNGHEALDILAKTKNIFLIFMDINMPGMDGITATRRIREKGINTPIIFQTAYTGELDKEECLAAGGNEFITKPLGKDKLFVTLGKYLIKNEAMQA